MPKDQNLTQRASRFVLHALATGLFCSALIGPTHAAPGLMTSSDAAGQWDISVGDLNRACRMMLRPTAQQNNVIMPAGCRRALPILARVGAFDVPQAGHLALTDQSGQQVLDFAGQGGQPLQAIGPQGEIYRLVAVPGVGPLPQTSAVSEPVPPPGFQPIKIAERSAGPSRAAAALKPSDVAGRYAVLREEHRDTGCMITLDDHARAAQSSAFRATLAPACRDQGIVIFDPMGWQIVSGHLVLTARKGHTAQFNLEANETWLKDAKEGKPLGLKKL